MYFRIGKYNVTQLTSKVQTQGSRYSCARTLTATVLQPPYDDIVPRVSIAIGDTVTFKSSGHEFYGVVFDVQRRTSSDTVDVTAFDMCIYANKNKICFKAKNTTPEAMAHALISKIGLPYGNFESTNFRFSKTFYNTSIYDAIMTAYGYASTEIGEKYYMCADKTRICVKRKGAYVAAVIKPKQSLIDATYKVSAQNAVNRVEVRDDDGKLIKAYKGEDESYGIFTSIIRSSDTSGREAKKALEDGKVEKTASVTNLGNARCVTGNAVIVEESHTGMYGLFYIDSDTHTWESGVYTNSLTLNYRNIMDKASVYKAEQSSSSGSSDSPSDESTPEDLVWSDPNGNVYDWSDNK